MKTLASEFRPIKLLNIFSLISFFPALTSISQIAAFLNYFIMYCNDLCFLLKSESMSITLYNVTDM